jgi:hypothetical protein
MAEASYHLAEFTPLCGEAINGHQASLSYNNKNGQLMTT